MNKPIYILLLLLCLNCGSPISQNNIKNNTDIHVLFIGNSLTYTNNLPKLVEREAKKNSVNLTSKMIAFPNYAIEDHWNDGKVQQEIASKKYDFVVLQQGPSSQSAGRQMLIQYGKKYRDLCKANNSKLCFFMVWPSQTYFNTFNGVIKNYRDAAKTNEAILLPVGEVWKSYIITKGRLDYYSDDGFHPSLKGSQIAAEVISNILIQEME